METGPTPSQPELAAEAAEEVDRTTASSQKRGKRSSEVVKEPVEPRAPSQEAVLPTRRSTRASQRAVADPVSEVTEPGAFVRRGAE